MEGSGHILTPARLDPLSPYEGGEELLMFLSKDKVTAWGSSKTEEVKYCP